MKGEVFNLLEQFVDHVMGTNAFEAIYGEVQENLSTKEPFVGPGTYPDSDFFAILSAVVLKSGLNIDAASRAFGKYCFPLLAKKIPGLLEAHAHPKLLLLAIHDVVHVEVRKVYRGAEPPHFEYVDTSPSTLTMVYRSKRKLFSFFEGLVAGMAVWYDMEVSVRRELPVNGESEGVCHFHLTFERPLL